MTLPAGSAPNASATGTSVDLAWAATTFSSPVDGYIVHSYDAATGTSRSIGPSCSGVLAALSCTDTAIPDGTWYYTITPVLGNWRGSPGPASTPVTIEQRNPTATSVNLV